MEEGDLYNIVITKWAFKRVPGDVTAFHVIPRIVEGGTKISTDAGAAAMNCKDEQ